MSNDTHAEIELSKTYDPAAVEPEAYQRWIDEGSFTANPQASGEPYSIVIPPPNVTGALHLGHAINSTLQDILIRRARMQGKNVLWVPGIDHAGIATQAVVEKQLKEKENKTRHDVGREALVERIWTWKQQFGDRILNQLQRLGCSCDWSRTRFTLDETLARAVRETFFRLFRDGLIYRGKRLVNWDVYLQTSISDDEIYHETVTTSLWHIEYPIEGSDRRMTIATTRPETLLGDTAVAVHSEDARWNWAIGKQVRLPLTNRLIPIIADDILVDPKFGSGVVKVTPAHDPNDYAVWQRHLGQNDEIGLINILNPDGTLNENAGAYKGIKRKAAREKVVADLDALGLLAKTEAYETQVGHSDRSKTPVEPYLSDQWFIKMGPLAEPALEVVRQGLIQFFPERHAQQYLAWLGEKRDWPISRQLWWGHRIPVWRAPEGGGICFELKDQFIENGDIQEMDGVSYICLRQPDANFEKFLEDNGYAQEADVLDTWFSSALWPFSTLGWPDQTADLVRYYPTSVLVTGRDIITLWVARMVMMGLYDMGQGAFLSDSATEAQSKIKNQKSKIASTLPFAHVAINPTILDGNGERMSKSKGNGVDPVDIIETYGADALRFTLTTMATETQDVRMPVKKRADGHNTSDKFDVGRNFCNKLWNAGRFALSTLAALPASSASQAIDPGKWSLSDHWIITRFNRTVEAADQALNEYRFDQYAKACYDFFWGDFCDWYVETTKPAMKDPARAGQTAHVLAKVLDGSLRLMHPMIPFITETLWGKLVEVRPDLKDSSPLLIGAAWPTVGEVNAGAEHVFPRLQDIITTIRNIRNEYKIEPKRVLTVSLAPPGNDAARVTIDNRELIELLAVCKIRTVEAGLTTPVSAAHAVANGCDVYVEEMVDPDAEAVRHAKRRAELTKQIGALRGRLASEAYTSKAPPHLVQQTRDQLAAAEAELEKLG